MSVFEKIYKFCKFFSDVNMFCICNVLIEGRGGGGLKGKLNTLGFHFYDFVSNHVI